MGRRREEQQRVRAGKQGPSPSYPGDVFVFTEHVPDGKLPCDWCCRHAAGLAVMPGYFRDIDVDGGSGRYGVCANCAGTGIEFGLSKERRDEILRLRFRRSDIADGQLPRLQQQLTFAQLVIAGRAEVCAIIDRGTAAFEANPRTQQHAKALIVCARMLDVLFPRSELEERYEYAIRTNSGLEFLARLHEAREAVVALVPEVGTPELQQLFATIRPYGTQLEAEHNRCVDWVNDPFPYEEFQLLLLVRWYWLEAGRPTGCYAEDLVHILEDEILSPPPPAPRRVIAPEIAARFQPDEIPPELEGLDGALLADLHDCMSRFGMEDHQDAMRRASLREPTEVHVSISAKPGNRTIMIVGPGGQTSEGAHMLRLPGPEPAMVLWDTRVRVDDIRAFIAQIDAIMAEHGFVHSETGERTTVVSDLPTSKNSVDRVFAKPGVCVPVLPGGPDAETMRQRFDRPEEVVIMTSSFGVTALHHQRDVPMLQRREEIVKRVLARHGLTTIDKIGAVPWDRIVTLREEIEREIAAEAS